MSLLLFLRFHFSSSENYIFPKRIKYHDNRKRTRLHLRISDEEMTLRFKEAIRLDNEKRNILGLPTSGFDAKTRRAYLKYPDGTREYVKE